MPTPNDLRELDARTRRFMARRGILVDAALVLFFAMIFFGAWLAGFVKGKHP